MMQNIDREAEHDRILGLINAQLEVAADDDDHLPSSLLELAGDLVSRFEQEHNTIEAANPRDMLRFLMNARGPKQDDLSAIVPQCDLSTILAGKRNISAAMAGKLGKFFGVGPAVFVPT